MQPWWRERPRRESSSFRLWRTGYARGVDSIQTSLEQLEKKGRQSTKHVRSDACRLKTIVSLHEEKQEVLSQIRNMREWVMEVEQFSMVWASQAEEISNAEVAVATWMPGLARSPALWKQKSEQKTRKFV